MLLNFLSLCYLASWYFQIVPSQRNIALQCSRGVFFAFLLIEETEVEKNLGASCACCSGCMGLGIKLLCGSGRREDLATPSPNVGQYLGITQRQDARHQLLWSLLDSSALCLAEQNTTWCSSHKRLLTFWGGLWKIRINHQEYCLTLVCGGARNWLCCNVVS